MRVGIVAFHHYGGSGVLAAELGLALAQRGHEVHFISHGPPAVRVAYSSPRMTWHTTPTLDLPAVAGPPGDFALASLIRQVAAVHRLDVLHAHYAIPHAVAVVLARDMLRDAGLAVPAVVTTLHGTDVTRVGEHGIYREPLRYALANSDAVTAVSRWLSYQTRGTLCPARQVQVIPNFVDMERFAPAKEREPAAGGPVIAHVSNFRPVKRIADVMAIFAQVVATTPASLVLAGDGRDHQLAERLARHYEVDEHVRFLGEQPHVEQVYRASDVLLLASEQESFSLAALEALACGVPVVGPRVGGLPEVVRNGKTGLLFEVGDVAAGAACLRHLLLAVEQRRQMASAARRDVVARFDPDTVVPQYVEVYEKAMANVAVSPPFFKSDG